MSRRISLAALAVIGVFALTGCLREDGTYILNEDNTVDGTIVLAIDTDYVDPTTPTSPFDAPAVAAGFLHSTVTDLGEPGWLGDRVTFTDEPITTFLTATEDYEIAVSRVGTQYVVTGAAIDPNDASTKQTVTDNGGSMTLKVTFPGPVVEHNGSLSGTTVTWNMLTQDAAPYARGSAVPSAAPPAPDPVVTVVMTPHAVASPTATPAASAAPSTSAVAEDSGTSHASSSSSSSSIPVWIWIVGGVLLLALIGLGAFLLATKLASKPTATPAPEGAPTPPVAPAPTAVPAPEAPPADAVPDVQETKDLPKTDPDPE